MATPTPPPPLFTLVKDQPFGPWQCDICAEHLFNNTFISGEEQPWKTPEGDLVCSKYCIKPLFEKALEFDIEYPARWGNIEINIDEFAVLWPDGVFPASYKAKGARLKREMLIASLNPKEFMPNSLVVGKDIQPCSKCKTPWGLKDGCNHMTCKTCGMNYCFLCGKEAWADSGHWREPKDGGSCPRYNGFGDENAVYDGADEEAGDWSQEIAFETWVWNITIQNASERTQHLQQRMLGLPVPTDHQGRLNTEERRHVLSRMLQYRLEHGVSREAWAELLAEHRHEAVAFVGGGNFFFEQNIHEDPIRHGVLARPIGGVFNLASETARRDAYEWAQQRYSVWTPTIADHPLNLAILDIGPGTPEEREEAAEILDILTVSGEDATDGQIEFTVIQGPLSQFMLAQVRGRGLELDDRFPETGHSNRENPLFSLRFEFIRPQNARERAEREHGRQELGSFREAWFVDAPQPGNMRDARFDLALERAMLADIEMIHQNRLPRFDITAQAQQGPRPLVGHQNMDQIDGLAVPGRPPTEANTRLAEDAGDEMLELVRQWNFEERQREADHLDQRAREMFQERRAQAAALAAETDNETIFDQEIVPARAVEATPRRRRRSPFAEQSVEPWAQPWDDLTRAMPGSP